MTTPVVEFTAQTGLPAVVTEYVIAPLPLEIAWVDGVNEYVERFGVMLVNGLHVMVWLASEMTKFTAIEALAYIKLAAAVAVTPQVPTAVKDKTPVVGFTVQPVAPADVTE